MSSGKYNPGMSSPNCHAWNKAIADGANRPNLERRGHGGLVPAILAALFLFVAGFVICGTVHAQEVQHGRSRFTASFLVAPYLIEESVDPDAIFDAGANIGIGGGGSWELLRRARQDTISILSVGLGVIFERRQTDNPDAKTVLDATPVVMVGALNDRLGLGYGYFTGRRTTGNRHRLYIMIPVRIEW